MIRVIDDTGQTLEFSRPPQRIIALTPHLTELLFAVGAGSQMVGVDSASDYPRAALKLPRVGDYSRIGFERVLALKPDLIVVWMDGNRAADIHGLKKMGLPILQTRATQLSDVARLLRLLGRATGQGLTGELAARDFIARLTALQAPSMRRPPLRVFYQVWDRPLMTVGGTHWISDALTLCGARNVFSDLHGLSPVVSQEAVLQRAPEVIVSGSDGPDMRAQWQRFPGLPAVRNGAFVRLNADRLHRPTPRLVEGVASLCHALEPALDRSSQR
ncbi:MAG: cobalamin-binding protein [Hydrogenophilales bacterium 12-61-10]|nr:MAG: cobalamin-binding protein [Hydrogenophilales bacterium 12-61-10]OYX29117.1 MAG: cobalamin-binding protein [Hydrogenophilales bacterium 32-62-9]